MKAKIHPKYYPEATVTCACGHSFTTGSTQSELQVDICSNCHPFFTGEQRFVDVQGRVEKFQARRQAAKGFTKKSKQHSSSDNASPQSLKEMLKKQ